MNRRPPQTPEQRLRGALELFDFAVRQIRRRAAAAAPEDGERAADEAVRAWLLERPGAERGDGPQPTDDSHREPR